MPFCKTEEHVGANLKLSLEKCHISDNNIFTKWKIKIT